MTAQPTLLLRSLSHLLRPGGVCTIHWLSFSRNFGKESALLAGLRAASGDYIATLDADLQDPPVFLPQMYELLLEFECEHLKIESTEC